MSLALSRNPKRKIPVLVVMATIFALSHQPGDALHLPSLPGLDKLAHAGVYGLLAATALFAFAPYSRRSDFVAIVVRVVIFCLLFGFSDELHQTFIEGRFASGWDLLADGFGALVVAGLWWWRRVSELSQAVNR